MSRSSSLSTSADPRLAVGQPVYLREALPEIGLERGAIGAVVMVFTRPRLAYEVEFVGEDGATRALTTLLPEQISATEPDNQPRRKGPTGAAAPPGRRDPVACYF